MSCRPVRLRAHHGMCLAFFEGKGYSTGFVKHMALVQHELKENPLVCVVCETDIICRACPNHHNAVCTDQEKVVSYDREVLRACGLAPGAVMPYHSFQALVYDNILTPGKRASICGDCQWTALCHFKNRESHTIGLELP